MPHFSVKSGFCRTFRFLRKNDAIDANTILLTSHNLYVNKNVNNLCKLCLLDGNILINNDYIYTIINKPNKI